MNGANHLRAAVIAFALTRMVVAHATEATRIEAHLVSDTLGPTQAMTYWLRNQEGWFW
ncbi:MAG: hypothetical protein IT492_11540, partial [Gammaproteobacteria bacterium]|nr:hypothetical protein [Gammaproteobacteria bacterium]